MINPIEIILATSILVGIFVILAIFQKEPVAESTKKFLYWGMVIPITFTTLFLVINTVIENTSSVTKGPVHWHADFEIYACGEGLDLEDPTGIANRIGTPVLHEHGDFRIHVEGSVHEYDDVNLASFFKVVGGKMTKESIALPTNQEMATYSNGDPCPGGSAGEWQAFLYKTTDNKYATQQELPDFPNYVMSHETIVPPGDCVILEFNTEPKERTENICAFYEIAIEKGELEYKQ